MSPRLPRLSVWPPLPPGTWLGARGGELSFPLGDPNCRLYPRARHALFNGVLALGLEPGDEVLVPAFHHGAEVEALHRAGLVTPFHDLTTSMEPDPDELSSLIGPRTRALHLIHYLGFPQDAVGWREWCERHGLLLFEDAAQAWLAERDGHAVGSVGDLAIYSLYKTFGLPDGAALVSRRPPDPPGGDHPDVRSETGRRHLAWLGQRLPRLAARPGDDAYDPVADFDLGDPDRPPSGATLRLLPRITDPRAAGARRANYEAYLDRLQGLVAPGFDPLPAGASPMAFPVMTDDKPGLLDRLSRRGIGGLNLWSVPHPSVPAGAFPTSERLRGAIVGLPVHQEMRPRDIDRVARSVSSLAGERA